MSSSTRPSRAGSRSAYESTRPGCTAKPGRCRPGRRAASRAPRTRRASSRCRGARPARLDAEAAGLTACQMSTYGWPTTSTCGRPATCAAMRVSFEPGTRWSTSTPSRRSGSGPNSRRRRRGRRCRRGTRPRRPRRAGRRPRPARRARRRGVPRRRCGSAGRPGRRVRRPRASPTRCAAGRGRSGRRRDQDHGPAVEQEAGTERERPCGRVGGLRGSTVPRSRSTRTIAPQKPVAASSTTRPSSATASLDERPRGGGDPVAGRTSLPNARHAAPRAVVDGSLRARRAVMAPLLVRICD